MSITIKFPADTNTLVFVENTEKLITVEPCTTNLKGSEQMCAIITIFVTAKFVIGRLK